MTSYQISILNFSCVFVDSHICSTRKKYEREKAFFEGPQWK